MAEQFYKKPTEEELAAAFEYFDKDNSGFITEQELYMAMSRFKGSITKADIQKMIRIIDKDQDNRINKNGNKNILKIIIEI